MKKTILILAIGSLAVGVTQAAVVAQYDFSNITDDGDESTVTFLAASVDSNADTTASQITSPATHNGGVVHPEFGDALNNGIGWSGRGINPAANFGIIAPIDTYFSFDITIAIGYNLTSFDALTGVASTIGGTTAYDYTLSYSFDGTSFTDIGTVVSGVNAGESATLSGNGSDTGAIGYDLTGVAALQGVSGQVYFRLDPTVGSGTSTNGVMAQRGGWVDDVVVNGTVVPEPSSAVLLGLGGFALILRRRK